MKLVFLIVALVFFILAFVAIVWGGGPLNPLALIALGLALGVGAQLVP
jgi:hypothetical protein